MPLSLMSMSLLHFLQQNSSCTICSSLQNFIAFILALSRILNQSDKTSHKPKARINKGEVDETKLEWLKNQKNWNCIWKFCWLNDQMSDIEVDVDDSNVGDNDDGKNESSFERSRIPNKRQKMIWMQMWKCLNLLLFEKMNADQETGVSNSRNIVIKTNLFAVSSSFGCDH